MTCAVTCGCVAVPPPATPATIGTFAHIAHIASGATTSHGQKITQRNIKA